MCDCHEAAAAAAATTMGAIFQSFFVRWSLKSSTSCSSRRYFLVVVAVFERGCYVEKFGPLFYLFILEVVEQALARYRRQLLYG